MLHYLLFGSKQSAKEFSALRRLRLLVTLFCRRRFPNNLLACYMLSRTHDRSSMTRLNESSQEHKCGKWRTRGGSAYENALEYAYEIHLLIFSCICLCPTSSRKTAESVHPRLELVLIYFWMQLFMVPIARLAVNRSLGENAMKVLIKYRDFPFSPSLFVPLCLRKFGSTFDLWSG